MEEDDRRLLQAVSEKLDRMLALYEQFAPLLQRLAKNPFTRLGR